ncbi:hypothetical protein Vafri_4470, partial [Volvox africanus]
CRVVKCALRAAAGHFFQNAQQAYALPPPLLLHHAHSNAAIEAHLGEKAARQPQPTPHSQAEPNPADHAEMTRRRTSHAQSKHEPTLSNPTQTWIDLKGQHCCRPGPRAVQRPKQVP